jgi:uncharacterized cupredoxin-like copper-binding protein
MIGHRWFVLGGVLAVAVAALVPAALGTSSARYTVTALDFKYKLSPLQLKAGKQTLTVINRGQATHDFKIGNKAKSWKTRILNPGQRQTITVTLRKGARYTYICTVPGHALLGMKRTVLIR